MSETPHTLSSFEDELQQLRVDLIQMGNLVSRALEAAGQGLLEGDLALCSDVIADDEIVDGREKGIDQKGMEILLRFTPVASDLRMVVSTLNVSRSLERIADHAVHIAKGGRKIIKSGESCPEVGLVEPVYQAARKMFTEVMIAYADEDAGRAQKIREMDKEVDRLHRKLSKALTQMLTSDPKNAGALIHLLFISRSIERIGDLAVNVAEDIIFIASAEDVRHEQD